MKAFLKKNLGIIIILAVFLLFAGFWFLFWDRISNQVTNAAYRSVFDTFSFEGAYYVRCDLQTVQAYLPETDAVTAELFGKQLGELNFPTELGTETCPLYACKPMQDAGKKNAVVLLEKSDGISAYELSGFEYLDEQTSIWAVCASYGISYAEDIESVTVKSKEGELLETITDSGALSDFVEKLLKLGDDIGEAGISEAYYNAYTEEFGETGQIWLEDDTVKAENDDVYNEAMDFWTKDLRLVTISLKNGYQLRDCIYAPIPGTFSIYGDYAITEPFFS